MITQPRDVLAGFIGVAFTLIAWWVITALGLVDGRILLSPNDLIARAAELDWNSMIGHALASMYRVIGGFVVGGFLGMAVGVLTAWSRVMRDVLTLPLELLRPISPLAWIPLTLIWFGTGDMSKVFVIAIGSFFVMLTNTDKGVRHLEPSLIRQARSYNLKGFSLIRRVVLPGIAPELMVGASVAVSISFASVVAAEMLGADSGLGYLLMQGRLDGDFGLVLLSIIAIAGLAYSFDLVVRRLVIRHPEAYEN